jgi:Domain of unknown function (DUF397)
MPAPQQWRKSSYSGSDPDCVEVAFCRGIRDSKNPGAGALRVDRAAYRALLVHAKRA